MTITAHIVVQGADQAAAFYRDAFGAIEFDRIPTPTGGLCRSSSASSTAICTLPTSFPEMGVLAPPSIGGTPVVLALNVADAEAVFAQAVTAGATVRQPVRDCSGATCTARFSTRSDTSGTLASTYATCPMMSRGRGSVRVRLTCVTAPSVRPGCGYPNYSSGTMTFGEQGGVGAAPEESRRIVDAYADAGGNTIDTAINYRAGASEEILGEILAGRRDQFVLASKYTVSRDRDDPNAAGNHRKNLRLSLDTSLRRLRTDYLDIYWVHMWDRHTPVEETMRALDDEVRAGRILYVGISDTPAWVIAQANTLAQWHEWTAFVGLQVPYNLLQRDIERELLPMAEALNMSVAVWSPLAGGILSGKYTRQQHVSSGATRINPGLITEPQHRTVTTLQTVADELGATAAQVAIAWTRSRSPAVYPIIGARSLNQLRDNLAAANLRLPDDAAAELDKATHIDVGFPMTFIAETSPWVFGAAALKDA